MKKHHLFCSMVLTVLGGTSCFEVYADRERAREHLGTVGHIGHRKAALGAWVQIKNDYPAEAQKIQLFASIQTLAENRGQTLIYDMHPGFVRMRLAQGNLYPAICREIAPIVYDKVNFIKVHIDGKYNPVSVFAGYRPFLDANENNYVFTLSEIDFKGFIGQAERNYIPLKALDIPVSINKDVLYGWYFRDLVDTAAKVHKE